MNIDELNAKYDEIFAKNTDIQQLFSEVEDYNEILFFLYDTEIKRPNAALSVIIDNYESLIFKIRESHKSIKDSLAEFGDEKELAQQVNNNDQLTEKIKDLILWKLRRLFMVYDEQPILPYIEGDFLNTDLIGNAPPVVAPPAFPDETPETAEEPPREQEVFTVEENNVVENTVENEAMQDETEQEEEEEDYDRFAEPVNLSPEGGIFPSDIENRN